MKSSKLCDNTRKTKLWEKKLERNTKILSIVSLKTLKISLMNFKRTEMLKESRFQLESISKLSKSDHQLQI